MGNNQVNKRQSMLSQQPMSCFDDLTCQNIDSKRSTVDNLVLVCPGAKCTDGTCSCGPGCQRDPLLGICCSRVETDANGNTFCIEEPYNPNNNSTLNAKKNCKVPNQIINGVTITGQQICDMYSKYQ
jgi:hypothetical protein